MASDGASDGFSGLDVCTTPVFLDVDVLAD